mgnify:CR=1 FL=1
MDTRDDDRAAAVMDVLTAVRTRRYDGVVLRFIDSEGRNIEMRLAGNVARDLRDELNGMGEDLG